jgi:transcription elongation factor Elf1
MFSRTRTDVIFACPKCGLLHVATQECCGDEAAGRIDCVGCGAMVHSWVGPLANNMGVLTKIRWRRSPMLICEIE